MNAPEIDPCGTCGRDAQLGFGGARPVEPACRAGRGRVGTLVGVNGAEQSAEVGQKRAGWDCWWQSCDKTVSDEPLSRTRPKGQAGEFMCAQHAEQRRLEEADRG